MGVDTLHRTLLLSGLVMVIATGCDDGDHGGTDASTDTGADTTGTCETPSGSTFDLEGTWALKAFIRLRMQEHADANIHVCNDPPIAMATVTWVMQVGTQDTSGAPFTFRTCDIQLPEISASFAECAHEELLVAYLHTGDALDEALPLSEYTGKLTVDEIEGCISATTNDLFVHIGISRDYDASSPLPGWDPECAGTTATQCVEGFEEDVLDTDSDGDPAATFWIETDPPGMVTGTAWATLRHTTGLSASRLDDALVTGTLDPTLEYDFVGSDATMAGLDIDTPAVQRNFPVFIPLADGSIFTMVRVDGTHGAVDLSDGAGTVSCAAVMGATGLFE